jgi:hypothetical protein
VAAVELVEAAGRAAECTARRGNLSAAWKLLGDAQLALGRTGRQAACCLTPAAPAPGPVLGAAAGACSVLPAGPIQPPVEQRAAALVAGWAARVEDARAAQRAYAAALHLAPGEGGAWGDVGAALAAEAQLRRAHARVRPQAAAELRARAERLLRGGPAGARACMRQCRASLSHVTCRMRRAAPVLATRARACTVS